jgi:dihydroorotate dehydrogenase
MIYRTILRPLLFALDPEDAHNWMKAFGKVANNRAAFRVLRAAFHVTDPRLEVKVAGLTFSNPVGLAAGLDKNVDLVGLCAGLGFGHLELGTVTALPQPGNPRPRIFRLTPDGALINRMGFPSMGADVVQKALERMRSRFTSLPPVGINIGKSKVVSIQEAVDDYSSSFERLAPFADYVAINVSSPNTPGLRELQDRDRLTDLLQRLQGINSFKRPLFVKVAPDLEFAALREVVDVCCSAGVSGIIATNTTLARIGVTSRIDEAGGLSGSPLRERSLEVVRFLSQEIGGRLALIGVGGVSCAEDVLAMLAAGASVVQLYTSLIYQGPGLVRAINSDLVSYMDREGCSSLQEATAVWKAKKRG